MNVASWRIEVSVKSIEVKFSMASRFRGCLHDNGATFIMGRDEKLHRVYIKPCLLGCESYRPYAKMAAFILFFCSYLN